MSVSAEFSVEDHHGSRCMGAWVLLSLHPKRYRTESALLFLSALLYSWCGGNLHSTTPRDQAVFVLFVLIIAIALWLTGFILLWIAVSCGPQVGRLRPPLKRVSSSPKFF